MIQELGECFGSLGDDWRPRGGFESLGSDLREGELLEILGSDLKTLGGNLKPRGVI